MFFILFSVYWALNFSVYWALKKVFSEKKNSWDIETFRSVGLLKIFRSIGFLNFFRSIGLWSIGLRSIGCSNELRPIGV